MNKNKIFHLVFILIFNICLIACLNANNKPNEDKPDGKKPQPQETANKASVDAPNKFSKVLVGKIDKYDVVVELNRDNEDLTGNYFYETNKPQVIEFSGPDTLSLSGKVKKDGTFTITETETKVAENGESSDKVTGTFTGKIVAEERGGKLSIKLNGDWTKADGSKKLNFFASEKTLSLGEGVKVVDKKIAEDNKKEKYTFDADFPQIEGSKDPNVAKFNKEMEEKVQEEYQEFKEDVSGFTNETDSNNPDANSYYDMSYDIQLANKNLISVKFTTGSYSIGAAHPNGGVISFNYSFKLGKEIELEDLFIKNSPYMDKINAICKKLAGTEGKYGFFFDLSDPKEDLEEWNFSEKGLYLHFGVAHAFGDVGTIFIPYSELKDVINPSGVVAEFIK